MNTLRDNGHVNVKINKNLVTVSRKVERNR